MSSEPVPRLTVPDDGVEVHRPMMVPAGDILGFAAATLTGS
jgi:hypothetical protein